MKEEEMAGGCEGKLGLQMERFLVVTILDPDLFLNKGSRSGFDSEPILLIPDPIPIEISRSM